MRPFIERTVQNIIHILPSALSLPRLQIYIHVILLFKAFILTFTWQTLNLRVDDTRSRGTIAREVFANSVVFSLRVLASGHIGLL